MASQARARILTLFDRIHRIGRMPFRGLLKQTNAYGNGPWSPIETSVLSIAISASQEGVAEQVKE